jgi:hypothetical protein
MLSFIFVKKKMKAIVMFQKGGMPEYVENFPEPGIDSDSQLVMTVQASAIKHLDRSTASGTHYSAEGDLAKAKVIGGDGVGFLEDGTKVFALGVTGMMAEKSVIEKSKWLYCRKVLTLQWLPLYLMLSRASLQSRNKSG